MQNSSFSRSYNVLLVFGAAVCTLGCATKSRIAQEGDASLSFPNEVRISNLRQLTYEGQNAEAYFSYDDSRLTFQYSGKDAKCDQIYSIGVDGKNLNRISSGKGRTTCSYFTPNDKHILYSTTALSSPDCPEIKQIPGAYTWPVLSSYQFVRYNTHTKATDPAEPGAPLAYHAELTTCRNGSAVFTSNRDGDLELYTATVEKNGYLKNIKRFTNHLGYDGGAAFSKNCEWIVWRRSSPETDQEKQEYVSLLRNNLVKPTKLEIWEARLDGTNARQITRLSAASFAPVYAPDQETILFSTNYFDPKRRTFDLARIKRNGSELERITDSKSFDSFPMFSNSGQHLVFSSNRNGRVTGETNLFLADWDSKLPAPLITEDDAEASNRVFSIARELSASDFEGRGVGSEGLKRAEGYLTDIFEKAGIRPYFGKSYEQQVPIRLGVRANWDESSFRADWKSLVAKVDFAPASFSKQGHLTGYIVDAGYGLYVPEKGLDDFYKNPVKGKIALIRRRVPKNLGLTKAQIASFSDLKYKTYLARERGAIGVLFWDPEGPEPQAEKQSEDLTYTLDDSSIFHSGDMGIPVMLVARRIANDFIKAPKTVRIELNVSLKQEVSNVANLVGSVGTTCDQDAPIVIGAHFDHLGLKSDQSFEPFGKGLHHGADDNASGVAALVEVARALKEKSGCYIIAAFSAEEIGVVGSSALVKKLLAQNIKPKAMLNFDMVGRLMNNSVSVFGTESSSRWARHLVPSCQLEHLNCQMGGDGYGPSDHMPFFLAQIPVLHFFTGNHADYHKSSDTVDKINATGIAQIASVASALALRISSPKVSLPFSKASLRMKPAPKTTSTSQLLPYLGTIPDYTPAAKSLNGVLLAGVKDDSPASQAGVRSKDVVTGIIVIDEKPGYPRSEPLVKNIDNLDVYTFVLKSLEPGLAVRIRVLRNGRILELPATVGRRASGIE